MNHHHQTNNATEIQKLFFFFCQQTCLRKYKENIIHCEVWKLHLLLYHAMLVVELCKFLSSVELFLIRSYAGIVSCAVRNLRVWVLVFLFVCGFTCSLTSIQDLDRSGGSMVSFFAVHVEQRSHPSDSSALQLVCLQWVGPEGLPPALWVEK